MYTLDPFYGEAQPWHSVSPVECALEEGVAAEPLVAGVSTVFTGRAKRLSQPCPRCHLFTSAQTDFQG